MTNTNNTTQAPAEELLTIEFTAWATEYVAGYVSQTGLQWVEHNNTVNDENGEQRAWVRNGYTGTTEQFAMLAWYLTQERQRCNLDPSYKRSLTMTLKKLPAPVDPATVNTPAPAEAPAEATEDTNTTPDMPSAEERDSDAFKAFAAEMKALLADVPDALPADMSDAHTLLCVQFAVDKRQHKPCKQYEWGSEFAQCGAELTIQQGIMQFTVPLQTSRQRELFKTLHECSILDDPEMEGARQYLFTQVVLPLARWGCTAQPQVNTALIECMYYEGAGAIIKAGYIACTSKLQ